MTYQTLLMLWSICVLSAIIVGLTLTGRLIQGIIRKNPITIKPTVKYILNIFVSYVFSFFAHLNFALWVNAPRGRTTEESLLLLEREVTAEVFEWAIIAAMWTGLLLIFNMVYQLKVERKTGFKSVSVLALADMMIMFTTIAVGSATAYVALVDEIKRYF